MAAAPVSCCFIARDCAASLELALRSVRPHVAEVCVVDTGSADGETERVAHVWADRVVRDESCNGPDGRIARFDVAREVAFALASQPWRMWLDSDDELVGGEHLAGLLPVGEGARIMSMPYQHGRLVYDRERVCSPGDAWRWSGWCHEVLLPKGVAFTGARTEAVRVVHHPTGASSEPGRNLRILRAQRAAEGDSERLLLYLGRELGEMGERAEAVEVLTRYLEIGQWEDERFSARRSLVDHHLAVRDWRSAETQAMLAIAERPDWAEGYLGAAKLMYFRALDKQSKDDMRRCVAFARTGLGMGETRTASFLDTLERAEIHRFLNVALHAIGDTAGALESARAGLRAFPEDEGMRRNAESYARVVTGREVEIEPVELHP